MGLVVPGRLFYRTRDRSGDEAVDGTALSAEVPDSVTV